MNRVLVVDDDWHAAEGLRLLLELDGYKVVALKCPQQALELLRAERFDALITDLEMPRHHGIELLEAARAKTAGMPVLVMTGYFGTPICDEALRAGARRVFGKPVDYDQLVIELADSLKRDEDGDSGF
jgi:two-component system response regulator PilR (NtrC family)